MEKKIRIITLTALVVNTILAVSKIVIGVIFNSMAVLSDGVDSATDILTSIVVLVATILSSKPPDKRHPYGHKKIENIGAKIISFVVFYAGITLLIESAKRLITKNYEQIFGILPFTIVLISMGFKAFLFWIEYSAGKRYDKPVLVAEALNYRNDIFLSLITFIGVFFNKLGLYFMDPLVAMIMSVIIIKVAFEIFNENATVLLDGIKSEDEWIYDEIIRICNECEGVENPHKIRVRRLGEEFDIDMDIEVDPEMTVKDAHSLTKCIMDKIKEAVNNKIYDIVIHVEPHKNIEEEPYGIRGEHEKKNNYNGTYDS